MMMTKLFYWVIIYSTIFSIFIFCSCQSHQNDKAVFQAKLDSIIAPIDAKIGISLIEFESNDTFSINDYSCFTMQSVFKFPIALVVLSEVENGTIKLNQRVKLDEKLLEKFSHSSLLRQNPKMDNYMSVDSLIMYMICYSDNISCDVLIDLIGGKESVNQFNQKLGFQNIKIKYSIIELAENQERRVDNCTKPSEMSALLKKFYNRELLNESNTAYLLNYMTNDSTTHKRILGDLPSGTVVAHKTGTFESKEKGNTSNVNDIGIISLPNGKHLGLSVFVSDSKENYETNEKVIAKISKTIYDYYLVKK